MYLQFFFFFLHTVYIFWKEQIWSAQIEVFGQMNAPRKPHHYPGKEHFQLLRKFPVFLPSKFSLLGSQLEAVTLLIIHQRLVLPVLEFHTKEIIQSVVLWAAFFTQHNVCESHLCSRIYRYFYLRICHNLFNVLELIIIYL